MAARLTTFVVVGIVAATLIAGLIVGAQRDDTGGPIDLIIHNAKAYTADADGSIVEALAIRGNQIVRVGSDRDVLRLRRPQTEVIDARGAAVVPGFNDAHVHLISGGLALDGVDVTGETSLDEVLERIRAWAAANPDRPWVLGRGWNYQLFPGGLPTRQLLDTLVPNRPARILSYDGQTAWVNTPALRVAGVTKKTADPANGLIVKDLRTGEPTGVLKGAAMALVERFAPAPTLDDRARALRDAIKEAQRSGITSVQVPGVNIEDLELYDEAARSRELQVRVYAALSIQGVMDEGALDRLESLKEKYADSPVFKSGALKIMLDGVIEAHTAAMLAPYANRADAGSPAIAPDDLNRFARLADARSWQILTHAVGDRAVRMALDAYAHAARSNRLPSRGRRHRIEHVETAVPADLRRFGALGVIASMQPFHASPAAARIGTWTRNIGEERASAGWPYRTIAAEGGRLAFGSDWPAAPMNPMLAIHAAVSRASRPDDTKRGWNRAQRSALEMAINAYTSGSAWASFDEQRKGTLEPGMLADIVILSGDVFEGPIGLTELAATRAAVTVFDGKVVYRRDRPGTD
jgi:predicted amidohydrolase YtcJ